MLNAAKLHPTSWFLSNHPSVGFLEVANLSPISLAIMSVVHALGLQLLLAGVNINVLCSYI